MQYTIGWTLNKLDCEVDVDSTGPMDLKDALVQIAETLKDATDCSSVVITVVIKR